MSNAPETLRQARASLEAGEAQAAYSALLGLPPLEELDLFVQAVGLLADVTRTFTTLLYQHIVNPWTDGEILDSGPEDEGPTSPEHVCKVARTLAPLNQRHGPRLRQRAGGPVLSNYFL